MSELLVHDCNVIYTLHKKWSFSLRISSLNVRIWSHLLKKSLMENFIYCAVITVTEEKVLLNWLNCFLNLILVGSPRIIWIMLYDFMSQFSSIVKLFMVKVDSVNLCQWSMFLWIMIWTASYPLLINSHIFELFLLTSQGRHLF